MSDSFDQDYRLGKLFGHGQFDAVYQCISVSTGEDFPVKIMDKFSSCFDRQSVYSEIKLTLLASAFENPRSVQIHQVYEDITAVYLILELCPGTDLFDRIDSHGPLDESEAAALITELVESIVKCHHCGIAHPDIKPENILFNSKGHYFLADFGCAALSEKEARTLKGKVETPAYTAPRAATVMKWIAYLREVSLPIFINNTFESLDISTASSSHLISIILWISSLVFGWVDMLRRRSRKSVGMPEGPANFISWTASGMKVKKSEQGLVMHSSKQ